MRLTLNRTETWRPPWNGNRELPEAEQIEIDIRIPTATDYSRLVNRGGGAFPSRQVWLDHVTAIRGLTVTIDEADRSITTAEQAVDLPQLGALVEQTVVRIIGLAAAPDPT